MSHDHENRLASSASAYLRSARAQPVAWQEWGEEAFARARRENKPVLLDIGAVWCHWCHVMDRESYENPETAAIINEHFVAVKVDRDERPEVDTRYQAAVAAISGQGGWPLTAFLTGDGRPYFGGTYFPPEERFGRPSFARVLLSMADAYRTRRDEVNESAGSVMEAIEGNEAIHSHVSSPGEEIVDKLLDAAIGQFDRRNGGFGAQPKFPHSSALDLLIDAAGRGGPRAATCREIVEITLRSMARGGVYDQLGGGFHRYSVDERWIVPHFEKMAYDNSELLKNYAHAFLSFDEPQFKFIGRDILRWMDEWLSDRERGGFYASQDADESLEDDGDYFTWTRDEAAAVLTEEELEVAAAALHLQPLGDMQHNPAKNVLRLAATPESISRSTGRALPQVRELLEAARRKLYAARLERPTPYIDKTIYTGWNAMCISAYLTAARAFRLDEPLRFALRSLDRVLAVAWQPGRGLTRVVAYGETGAPVSPVPGSLDDYALLATAALDAWEATGEGRYVTAAGELADHLLAHFYDAANGGFFDIAVATSGVLPLGALSAKRKPLQDSPTPAGNPVAAGVLLRLAALTGNLAYELRAHETLEAFAGVVEHLGLFAGSYGLALRRAITPPTQVCLVGEGPGAGALEAAGMAPFAVGKSVIRLRADQLGMLPAALAETLPHLPGVAQGSARPVAVVCRGNTCLPPVEEPEALARLLQPQPMSAAV